jgi:opacity protein-like surface antigen
VKLSVVRLQLPVIVLVTCFVVSVVASPASAQVRPPPPALSFRPFFLYAGQMFAAKTTFDAIFGRSFQSFYGGGLELAFGSGFFIDLTASQFRKTGERAFLFEGESFGLGIPLKATLTPFEVTAGGRFLTTQRVSPYLGAGIGTYRYTENSDFDDGGFSARHAGYLVVGGAELRLTGSIALSGDVQYTRVPGILGEGGISRDAAESDLGGIAGRVRVLFGL